MQEIERKSSLPSLQAIRKGWQNYQPPAPSRKGQSAVLIPLIEKEGRPHILFEQRALTLSSQPGEICFPGGRLDPGESPQDAAIRECCEELLLDPASIEILSQLPPLEEVLIPPIWPFVGILHDYNCSLSSDEVEQVLALPLDWFLAHPPEPFLTQVTTQPEESFPFHKIPGGRNYPWRRQKKAIWFYDHPEVLIWGMTAAILKNFLEEGDPIWTS